jgi:medium-chain acyl-[acyl-carrier-protein] hydrolase
MSYSMQHVGNKWFLTYAPKCKAEVRLFCLPHAGRGASIYKEWQKLVPPWIDVCPIQLPGRETRIKEPLIRDMKVMVDNLARAILPFLHDPYVLFGHSMGALITYELANKIRELKYHGPDCLFISGSVAPSVARDTFSRPVQNLSNSEFIEEIADNIHPAVLRLVSEPGLMSVMLPILRADAELIQTYSYVVRPPLETPIIVFGGTSDPSVPPEDLKPWADCTRSHFSIEMLEGDHFFVHNSDQVVGNILNALDRVRPPRR